MQNFSTIFSTIMPDRPEKLFIVSVVILLLTRRLQGGADFLNLKLVIIKQIPYYGPTIYRPIGILKARPRETTLSCTTCCVQHVSSCGRGNRLKISRARRQEKLCTTWKKVAPCSTLGGQILSLELKQPITQLISLL